VSLAIFSRSVTKVKCTLFSFNLVCPKGPSPVHRARFSVTKVKYTLFLF